MVVEAVCCLMKLLKPLADYANFYFRVSIEINNQNN
jgi:hypothetical protein